MAVSDEILNGQLKVANLVLANTIALQNGALKVNWETAIKGNRSVLAIQNRYSLGDTSSSVFQTAYACLTAFIGSFGGGAIDPNAQNPGVVIDVTSNVSGSNVVYGKIEFTNQAPVQLLNYNTTLKQVYGNNLVELTIFTGEYQQDEQTAPTITYATPNDPTTDIISIVWDYPVPVSGYISIAGVVPVTGTPSQGGTGASRFTYDQTALLFDGTQWYLPLMLPANLVPVSALTNGVGIPIDNYNQNFTPSRLYGFANDSTQVIVITVI